MSKFVKENLTRQVIAELGPLSSALLIDMSALTGQETTKLRMDLAKKGVKVRVVKNSIARRGLLESELKPLGNYLQGVNAVVFGGDSVIDVAKDLLAIKKKMDKLVLKGGIVEGDAELHPVDVVTKMKGRREVQAELLGLIGSPARRVSGCIGSPGAKIAGCIKAIVEKLEKGETIAKVA